ncbi:band 7 protein [Pedosphaera parvula Ellin514]|uniref:Band 7 protein n=2 Tax=Pedosphaera TaxID=1032526 RepID=B9XS49_PEDPL|nr:band 7 protein [Pedosphaera parvula Ellin514]
MIGAINNASVVSMAGLALAVLVLTVLGMVFLRKNLVRRIALFTLLMSVIWGSEMWWLTANQPSMAAHLAVQQLNGGDVNARNVRTFDAAKDAVQVAAEIATLLVTLGCFGVYLQACFMKLGRVCTKATTPVTCVLILLTLTGCMKPFDRPEYVEIDTSETGFLIPLEGDSTQQSRFQSEDYLKQRKVAAKRVQIIHRWSQEGRMGNDGRWIPTVRLVKVNRSPVTREWSSDSGSPVGGQARTRSTNDKAVWIESSDSVGFSMGFNCTAFISEDDAAKFLYWYPSGSLADVMDHEVRGRIQQIAAEVAARYPLDQLRSRKQEIADAVKKDVTTFFSTRGVTVTTVGMFGGMTYENPEIQRAIDQTFIAQQLKTVSLAKYEAQQKENERIELEANGLAEKARREASGLADAKRTAASAEAQAIREVSKALSEAQQNPLLYQFKALEVEKARVEKWDGKYPTYWMGTGTGGPNLMLQLPAPGGNASTH